MFQKFWPQMAGKPVNEQKVAQLEKQMNITLDLIENIWLKDKQFLCGDDISISDIIGICEIEQPSEKKTFLIQNKNHIITKFFFIGMAGFDPFANRLILSEWKTRVVSRLSPYYEEANQFLEIQVAKYSEKQGKINSKI